MSVQQVAYGPMKAAETPKKSSIASRTLSAMGNVLLELQLLKVIESHIARYNQISTLGQGYMKLREELSRKDEYE